MKRRTKEAGRAAIWTPFLMIAGCVALYLTLGYAPVLITYYQVRYAFFDVAHDSGRFNDDELRYELKRRLRSINPPFDLEKDLAITKVGNTVIIDARYEESVKHPFLKPHVFKLNPHTEVEVGSN